MRCEVTDARRDSGNYSCHHGSARDESTERRGLPEAAYTVREPANEVQRHVALHGEDGPKLLEGLRDPLRKLMQRDLAPLGVRREANHIDDSRYLYWDGEMSITFDHMPKGKFIPP